MKINSFSPKFICSICLLFALKSNAFSKTVDNKAFQNAAFTGFKTTQIATADSISRDTVLHKATYPGGEGALIGDLNNYLMNHYPEKAKENNVQGLVIIYSTIDSTGKIGNLHLDEGNKLGGGLDEAAMEGAKRLKRFNPATRNGKRVSSEFIIPVTFHLSH